MKFFKRVEENGLKVLAEKELEVWISLKQKRAGLDELEAKAGHALLDNDGAGNDTAIVGQVVRAGTEVNALERALAVVRSIRPDAVRAHYQREAGNLRRQSRELQQEADAINEKAAGLVAQLSELQECQMVGLATSSAEGFPTTPKSSALASQALQLIERAVGLEAKTALAVGGIDLEECADDIQAVRAVLEYPSMGPSASETFDFLAACEASARKRFPGIVGFEGRPRRVFIAWSNGKINSEQSYVFCAELVPIVTESSSVHAGSFQRRDTASAMFRPAAATA